MSKQSVPTVSRGFLWTALAAAGVLAGVVVFNGLQARAKDGAQLKALADKQSAVTVSVISPGSNTDPSALSLPGRIEAYAKAPLYSRISGYLKSWKADIGTPVKAGQVLAEIDTPDLDQQILQAKAELAKAERAKAAQEAKKLAGMNVRTGAAASSANFDGRWDADDALSAIYDRVNAS